MITLAEFVCRFKNFVSHTGINFGACPITVNDFLIKVSSLQQQTKIDDYFSAV